MSWRVRAVSALIAIACTLAGLYAWVIADCTITPEVQHLLWTGAVGALLNIAAAELFGAPEGAQL